MQVVATTAAHSLPDGSVTLLGAVRSVKGAMTRVDTRGASLLVDCGVAQGLYPLTLRFVFTAAMPQPMSTPTAAGATAPRSAITEPTVAPMPTCTSGMTATWCATQGRDAAALS